MEKTGINKVKKALQSDTFVLAAILVLMIIFFSLMSPYFLNLSNMLNVLRQTTEVAVVALPLTMIVVCGAMDLSVGSIVGFSAVMFAICFQRGMPLAVCTIAAFLTGLACGVLNGFFVAHLNMMPIMVTIGTMSLFRGVIYGVTNAKPISGFPEALFTLGQGELFGIPINVLITAVLYGAGIMKRRLYIPVSR